MSDWVLGYSINFDTLVQYALDRKLCHRDDSRYLAADRAINHISKDAALPPRQCTQTLCWTTSKEPGPSLVWQLGKRVNTRSPKDLSVKQTDLPPKLKSLIKLAIALGHNDLPHWYLHEDSYEPGETFVRGWTKEDAVAEHEKCRYHHGLCFIEYSLLFSD
jgi:hypothetical protein